MGLTGSCSVFMDELFNPELVVPAPGAKLFPWTISWLPSGVHKLLCRQRNADLAPSRPIPD
jgi:negative regulator of sigma E activity